MSVCVVSLDDLYRWQVQVSVYYARHITADFMCTQCSILLHHIDICFIPCICLWQISQIQTCLHVVCLTWIRLDIARFYEEQCQPCSGSAWVAFPKTVNRSRRGRHNLHGALADRCDRSTACRLRRVEP